MALWGGRNQTRPADLLPFINTESRGWGMWEERDVMRFHDSCHTREVIEMKIFKTRKKIKKCIGENFKETSDNKPDIVSVCVYIHTAKCYEKI